MPMARGCGIPFNDEVHVQSCQREGFVIMRHNVRDMASELLIEACHDVNTDPILIPLTGEVFSEQTITKDGARRFVV